MLWRLKKVLLKITQEDIDSARALCDNGAPYCFRCPIAVALTRELFPSTEYDVCVGTTYATIYTKSNDIEYKRFRIEKDALEVINQFDVEFRNDPSPCIVHLTKVPLDAKHEYNY